MPPARRSSSPWVRTAEPLLWLMGAAREVRRGDYFHDSAKRTDPRHVVLQLTLAGRGYYENRGGASLLDAGAAFIDIIPGPFRYGYPPGTPPAGARPYELVYVSMSGPAAEDLAARVVRGFGNVLKLDPHGPAATAMLSIARQRARGTARDRYLASAQLYQLFMLIFSELNSARVATAPRVARAMELIHAQSPDPRFGIGQLAQDLGCSREYLSRQFRQAIGVCPQDYLIQHRLRLAARAIRDGDEKLELVARRCGLSGANYLCRLFRLRYAMTPAEYRRRPWLVTP